MPSRFDDTLEHPALLAFLWVGAVAAVALLAGRYWIPLDDGTLAQSAERVLAGELPHRDFGDPYTGLNAVLGATAFKLFGVRLASLRIPLVAGFALWLPAVWSVSRRFLPPVTSLVATALAAVLSVLAYPAAMPTWFALFAVTWGAWALLRWLAGGRRGWLLACGASAGVAVLFKVVGLYFLAATLLGVALHRRSTDRAYAAVVVAGILAFLLLLARLVLPTSGPTGVFHFFLPALSLSAALVYRTLLPAPASTESDRRGLSPMLLDAAILTAGFFLPLALFLAPYALRGGVAAWVEGVFLLPGRRLGQASSAPGPLWTLVPPLVAVALVAAVSRLSAAAERRVALGAAALLALALLADDALDGRVIGVLWYALRGWVPALTLLAAARLSRGGLDDDVPAYAVLSVAALWGLVQFPYAAPAYFFYAAPLGVLATAACIRTRVVRGGPVLGLLAGVAFFLGAGYVTGVTATGTHELTLPRGGIRVAQADEALYRRLVTLVDEHRAGGGLWAGPDAPEVYFLAEVPNPTPTLYEFLDPVPRDADDLTALFREHDVRVVVVNTRPLFSPPLGDEALEEIVSRFPHGETVGPYLVRWTAP